MRRLITIFLLFAGLAVFMPSVGFGQSNYHENTKGGRKKEGRNTSNAVSRRGGLFKRKKSAGNADAFASNRASGGGFFHKMFHSKSSAPRNASLRKTKPGKVQNREQKGLFKRQASKHKLGNEKFQSRQRKERARNRSRGSSFSK